MTLKECKTILRAYLRRYPEERLAALLAHAQSGKLAYCSCCCLIGVETADHALKGANDARSNHYIIAKFISNSGKAEQAYFWLGHSEETEPIRDELRRRRIVPLIRAEFRRRDRERARVAGSAECATCPGEGSGVGAGGVLFI